MKNNLISVILPVFNAEKYLGKTIEDILNQSHQEIEVIIIDDGSTDQSWNIIQQYSQKDERIRPVRVSNGGPSKARNLGLEMVRGEYIRFIDADDSIPQDSIERMYKKIKENQSIDMVIGNYQCVPEQNYFTGDVFSDIELSKKEFVKVFLKNIRSFYYGVMWNKLYRRALIEHYQIRFDETINWCEDFCFNLEYYEKCSLISLISIPGGFYTYYTRDDSITTGVSKYSQERLQKINKICYEKILAFCNTLQMGKEASLEWKYYNLYYQLSDIVDRKQEHRQKYRKFKEILNREEVYEYICYKQNDARLWRILKLVIQKKIFLVAYILFYVKGIMVMRLNKIAPRIKRLIQKGIPKTL